jgi:hypothetical protein
MARNELHFMEDCMSSQATDSGKESSPNNLNRQVGFYSLAAVMAGVSVLALAEPAVGEVVVTKKTIPIPMVPFGTVGPVRISMANNGIDNFGFNLYNDSNSLIDDRGLGVWAVAGHDGVIVGGSFYAKALALKRGAEIGPSANFSSFSGALIEATEIFSSAKAFRGYWQDSKDRYLGVHFPINGKTHYGWIRVTVTADPQAKGPFLSAKITAYAYETVPNKPILAGTAGIATAAEVQVPEDIQKPGRPLLGILALGADGLPLWRREETFAFEIEHAYELD